jgi:hypothetical protein
MAWLEALIGFADIWLALSHSLVQSHFLTPVHGKFEFDLQATKMDLSHAKNNQLSEALRKLPPFQGTACDGLCFF